MYERLQAHARKTRLKIPLLYGVDAVHGHNNVLGAVVFPHNIGLGATRDATLVEEIGRITAEEVRATGIQWTFAPCVTVPRDERWGRTYEGFAEEPRLVAELGAAAVRGLQGPDLANPLRVLACAKHFVGDGGTTYGTGTARRQGRAVPLDQGDTQLDEAELRRIHMQGYVTAIEAGVASIMPSYNCWNGEKCSGSKRLLTDILKGELGFEGFLISDYNAIDELPGDYRADDQAVDQRRHGHGDGAEQVPRVLRHPQGPGGGRRGPDVAHRRRGDAHPAGEGRDGPARPGSRAEWPTAAVQKTFGSAEHRAVARRAVRESLVLLKNERHALPLSKGRQADPRGRQERRRPRQPVRRLDDHLAGSERRRDLGHHHPGRDPHRRSAKGTRSPTRKDGPGADGRRRGRGRGRRDALRGDARGPRPTSP